MRCAAQVFLLTLSQATATTIPSIDTNIIERKLHIVLIMWLSKSSLLIGEILNMYRLINVSLKSIQNHKISCFRFIFSVYSRTIIIQNCSTCVRVSIMVHSTQYCTLSIKQLAHSSIKLCLFTYSRTTSGSRDQSCCTKYRQMWYSIRHSINSIASTLQWDGTNDTSTKFDSKGFCWNSKWRTCLWSNFQQNEEKIALSLIFVAWLSNTTWCSTFY